MDLQKIVARIFRRSEIEVLFSEGYKTRPLISFGPALTLGISSLTEYFDVRVPQEWDNTDEILKKLQSHSESGIIFKSVSEITKKTPSIQDAGKKFVYYVQIDEETQREKAVEFLTNSSEIYVSSFNKKRKDYIQKDIRPKIITAYNGKLKLDNQTLDLIDEVSPCKGEGVFIETLVDSGSSVRPAELIKSLNENGITTERPIKYSVEI